MCNWRLSKVQSFHLKSQLHQVVAFECSVCTRHGNDFGLLHQEVLSTVKSAPQQLKGSKLL